MSPAQSRLLARLRWPAADTRLSRYRPRVVAACIRRGWAVIYGGEVYLTAAGWQVNAKERP
jgi:hypothetical protein